MAETATVTVQRKRLPYAALVTMMMTSFLLVTAEFLPNGLLTEMAEGLGVTPGQAGQTVTVTALVGFLVAPTIGLLLPRLDRRTLLVGMALAACVSDLIVAISPSLVIVLLSRVLLGAALSSFWAMSITVAARIAGQERLGRAVMFTTAGTSLATVEGVPLGVVLGDLLDWRAVFAVVGVVTGLLAIALQLLLPPVPAAPASSFRILGETLRRPGIALGLVGHILVVFGHSLAYTYVRLALDRIPDAVGATVLLLALFGAGGLVGNLVIGVIVDRRFAALSVTVPILIAVMLVVILSGGGSIVVLGGVVTVWGFLFASWLIVVNTWVGHRMPDRLEAGGGLVVVGFQAAIMLAAGLGGLLVDARGVATVYGVGAVLLVIGALLFGLSHRSSPRGITR